MAFQYHREKEFKAGEINAQLQLINNYILTELGDGVNPQDIRLDEFHPFDDLRVSIIAPDGKVHYDNSLDSLPSSNHLDRRPCCMAADLHSVATAAAPALHIFIRRGAAPTAA